jgi:hypothetical protein
VDGKILEVGESFSDGCADCACTAEGLIACTAVTCVCNPEDEYYRDYVAGAEECALMDMPLCPENTTYFSNDCGCGCEMSQECPETVDCMPGSDEELCSPALLQECPYSEIEQ